MKIFNLYVQEKYYFYGWNRPGYGSCISGQVSPSTGRNCNAATSAISAGVGVKVTYNLGIATLKNGSKGEAVKEL